VDEDKNVFGETSNGFIKGVVDDFGNKVVESPFVGRTDVHSRSLSDRF